MRHDLPTYIVQNGDIRAPSTPRYTHWDKLLVDIVEGPFDIKGIEDVEAPAGAYGFWVVRQLDRPQSHRNADSYAWLATEVWWTRTCFSSHGALQEPRKEKEDNAG